VTWIVAFLGPGFCEQVIDADVVPSVVKVLSADDEEAVASDGGELGVARTGEEIFGSDDAGGRQPVAGGDVEEADVVEDTQLVGIGGLWLVAHAAEDDELIIPWLHKVRREGAR
jgi:hypothetical protein